jgi:lipoprotein-anchoring transpeptidase ErfK/SrfK
MSRNYCLALLAGAAFAAGCQPAAAFDARQSDSYVVYNVQQSTPAPAPVPLRVAYAERSNMGGGFIEFLFSGGSSQGYQPMPEREPQGYAPMEQRQSARDPDAAVETGRPGFDPKYEKQAVDYHGKEAAGTVVIDTPNKFLYLVQGSGRALRYGIGVGKPGFTWSGVKTISAKKEWPAWTPPPEMLKRRPDLPRHMEGGPENPLGARAMYLGTSLYRIHGSNEPWTIGTNVSSGCIRMRNEDVIDLYGRVNVGTRVVVM